MRKVIISNIEMINCLIKLKGHFCTLMSLKTMKPYKRNRLTINKIWYSIPNFLTASPLNFSTFHCLRSQMND